MGVGVTAALGRAALEKHNVEGWLHLDHAEDPEMIQNCLDAGFDSGMIDASEKPFGENVEITSRITELAARYGANVETELGDVAKRGRAHEKEEGITKPEQAARAGELTGGEALAVAMGWAHG